MSRLILAWTALLLAVPAHGADRTDSKAVARSAPVSENEAVHAEMIAYSKWMMELDAATADAIATFRDLGPAWNAAAAGSSETMEARFRPTLVRVDESMRDARERLNALTIPSFPLLQLPADSEPTQMRADMLRMIGDMDAVRQTLPGMMAAIRAKDPGVGRRATVKMLDAARALFRAQGAMAAAWIATTEAGDPTSQSLRFEQLFFRSGIRLLDSVERASSGKPDPTLASDFRVIADEIDQAVTAGTKLVDAQRTEFTASSEDLAGATDPESVSARAIADKMVAVSGLQQEGFAASQRYAGQLRRAADSLGKGAVSMGVLQPIIDSLRTTRTEIDAIGVRMAQVMAGTH